MRHWTENPQTQAEVKVLILDTLSGSLIPPLNEDEAAIATEKIYNYVWQRSYDGSLYQEDVAA